MIEQSEVFIANIQTLLTNMLKVVKLQQIFLKVEYEIGNGKSSVKNLRSRFLRKGLLTRTLVFTHRYSFTSEGIYHRHVRFLNVPQIHDVLVSCGAVI